MKNRSQSNKNPLRNTPELTTDNLCELCWRAGYRGVVGLANSIGRSRVTVHRAVRWPDQFGPTLQLIKKALNV